MYLVFFHDFSTFRLVDLLRDPVLGNLVTSDFENRVKAKDWRLESSIYMGHPVIIKTVQNLMNDLMMRWNYASGPKYLKMLIYLC